MSVVQCRSIILGRRISLLDLWSTNTACSFNRRGGAGCYGGSTRYDQSNAADHRNSASVMIEPILYVDNSLALQLCTLDAGSWRTCHLRLRGELIRQSVEEAGWKARHLDGVYMCADIGTKPVGAARFADLVGLMGMDHVVDKNPTVPPNPKAASVTAESSRVSRALAALLILSQIPAVDAQHADEESLRQGFEQFCFGVGCRLGIYVGWKIGEVVESALRRLCCRGRQVVCTRSPSLDLGSRGHSRPAMSSLQPQVIQPPTERLQ